MRISSQHIILALAVFSFMALPCLMDRPPALVEALELKSLDLRFRIRGGRETSGQVVIAGIEARSIEAYGRWPWPRSVMAQLIVRLKDLGARTLAFDLLFPDPEENRIGPVLSSLTRTYKELGLENQEFPNQIFLDEMKELLAASDNDSLMAEALSWSGNVILGLALEPGQAGQTAGDLKKACYRGSPPKGSTGVQRPWKPLVPIPDFRQGAAGMGFVNIFPDTDGIVRRVSPVFVAGGKAYMPLAVAGAGHFLNHPPAWDARGDIAIGQTRIPGSRPLILDFYGLENSFERYAIADIIQGRIPETALKDKVVIVGGMATGLGDIWPTPLTGEIPGLFIQATFLDNILQNRIIRSPGHREWVQAGSILAMVLVPLGLTAVLPGLVSFLAGGIVLVSYGGLTQFLFESHLLVWPVVQPLAAGILTLVGLLLINLVLEGQQHRWIKKSFSQYLSRDVIDILVKDPDQLKLGGEEKEMTVLMADIRNFTSLSEGLSPTELTALLNLYLGEMTDVILANGGTLDKYMGDAVMAFFNAPILDPAHPATACRTAVTLFEHLYEKRAQWSAQGLPELRIGIGINTGAMIVGNLGSAQRFDYSVIGDHVNLASRLEGLSKAYGVKILVSEYTQSAAGTHVFRELDQVRVKGRQEPVRVFELLGKDYFTGNTFAFVESFETGLKHYRSRDFERALVWFEKTLELKPEDPPSRLFIKRCLSFGESSPPDNWDGTWTFTQK